GTNNKTNKYFVYLETIAGGSGAHKKNDGLSGVQVHMTNTSNLPIEALEREYPIMVENYSFKTDSGGPGLHRGGLGLKRQFRILNDDILFTGLGERHEFSPWGIAGGENGASGEFWLKRKNHQKEKLNSKTSNIQLNREDQIIISTPGAGGYGDTMLREIKKVENDVKEEKVSIQSDKKNYGVVIENEEVNKKLTAQIRSKEQRN